MCACVCSGCRRCSGLIMCVRVRGQGQLCRELNSAQWGLGSFSHSPATCEVPTVCMGQSQEFCSCGAKHQVADTENRQANSEHKERSGPDNSCEDKKIWIASCRRDWKTCCQGPEGKYFRLMTLWPCHHCSALSLYHESRQRQC